MFIDIHTHHPHQEGIFSIQNRLKDFDNCNSLYQYSVGLHPWFIDEHQWKDIFGKMKLAGNKNNIIAVGECGLDRLCDISFKIQQDVFIQHILWANEIAKPIIIHCVKAFDEVFRLLTDFQCNVPVIFHGFNNKKEIAERLIKKGYFISFGKALFNPSLENVFNSIPIENIFLETDDSDADIKSVYTQAGRIKNIPLDQLSLQIKKNFKKVFNSTSF